MSISIAFPRVTSEWTPTLLSRQRLPDRTSDLHAEILRELIAAVEIDESKAKLGLGLALTVENKAASYARRLQCWAPAAARSTGTTEKQLRIGQLRNSCKSEERSRPEFDDASILDGAWQQTFTSKTIGIRIRNSPQRLRVLTHLGEWSRCKVIA